MRGLRRAHHGERFGSEAEHGLWLAAANSDDPMRAALGRGYMAGLTLESRDPDVWCERCERVVIPHEMDGDPLCPRCRLAL